MIYRIEVSSQALEDLDSLAAWIADDNLDAAYRLFDSLAEQIQLLTRFPRLGVRHYHQRRETTEIRFTPVKGFEELVLYYDVCDATETITVRRILHGRSNRGKPA